MKKRYKIQGGEEYPTYNIKKEGYLNWPYLAQELPSITRDFLKHRGKDRSEAKTRKKTWADTECS